MSDVQIAQITERIGAMAATAAAMHSRQDKMEIRLETVLSNVEIELKELNAHMNQSKGGKAATVTIVGLVVALIGALAKILIH